VSWPEKTAPTLDASEKRTIGEGIFKKCDGCAATLTAADLHANFEVCPACEHHHLLSSEGWRRLLLDDGVLDAWDDGITPGDPLTFTDGKTYPERIAQAQKRAGARESVNIGAARLGGRPIAVGAFNFAFMGGSMGSVAGEKITRLFEATAMSSSASVRMEASSSPSTITRSLGSVPDQRTSTRPASPSFFSRRGWRPRSWASGRGAADLSVALTSTWGTRVMAPAREVAHGLLPR
jgi:hypothetical protein